MHKTNLKTLELNMLKRIVAGCTIAAVIGVGGIAVAQTSRTSSLANVSNQDTAAKTGAATSDAAKPLGRRHRLAVAAQIAAKTIGIDVTTLRTEVKAQGTIAAVATARGVAPQAVIDALVAHATTAIDKAVADGRISAERAAKMKTRLPKFVARFVNDTTNVIKHRKNRHSGGGKGAGGSSGADQSGTAAPRSTTAGATS